MIAAIGQAKAELEKQGLHVSCLPNGGLWIGCMGSTIPDDTIQIYQVVGMIEPDGDQWIARFCVEPPLVSRTRGSLEEVQSVASRVFQRCMTDHVTLWTAFADVIGDPMLYLEV